MRIISGKAKGKRLFSPRGKGIRPTADRVKESVFDILGCQWEDKRVLDLFSGTGSLGLEAMSRGSRHVVFVEASRPALTVLRKNILHCGFASRAVVLPMPVSRGLTLMGQRGETFHIIFADPPYGRGWVEKTIGQILVNKIFSRNGTVIIEHTPHEPLPRKIGKLVITEQRTYGDTAISFLRYEMLDKTRDMGDSDERIDESLNPESAVEMTRAGRE